MIKKVVGGLSGLRYESAPYRVERSVARFLVTREDMLKLGRKATKKIFEDYLNDRPQANPNACVRLLAMQYDRIDPVVRRTEIKSQIEHELISPELQKFLSEGTLIRMVGRLETLESFRLTFRRVIQDYTKMPMVAASNAPPLGNSRS